MLKELQINVYCCAAKLATALAKKKKMMVLPTQDLKKKRPTINPVLQQLLCSSSRMSNIRPSSAGMISKRGILHRFTKPDIPACLASPNDCWPRTSDGLLGNLYQDNV